VLDLPHQASDTVGWREAVRASLADGERVMLGLVTSDGRVLTDELSVLRTFADSVSLPLRDGLGASLAGALLAARREAAALAVRADSLALVVVSPLRADVTAPALLAARAIWPGRLQLAPVMTTSDAPDAPRAPVSLQTALGAPSADDSAFARRGGTVVVWPDTARQASPGRAADDSVFAVVARGGALVAPMRRPSTVPEGARPRAWYADGTVAVGETSIGDGCVRWVGFSEPAGDALLTGAARRLRAVLDDPCAPSDWAALPDSVRVALAGGGPLASRQLLAAGDVETASALAKWLLMAALGLLVIEQVVRARVRRGTP